MKQKQHMFTLALHLVLAFLVFLLLWLARDYHTEGPQLSEIQTITQVTASVAGGPQQPVELPCTFRDLAPRTSVVLRTTIVPRSQDLVYMKTVYSPAKVYLDGALVYEFGRMENYPSFMKDPATEVHMVETHGRGEPMELTMEFLSPLSRRALVVHPPMVGTAKEIISQRQHVLGLSLSFSLIQLFTGVTLILISLCILFLDKKGIVFLWLGLFSLAAGAWAFGENNFSLLIFKHTASLYLLSFLGFFTFMVPLIRFVRTMVAFTHPLPVWLLEVGMGVCAILALGLQLLGLVPCSTSMYVFHGILPPVMLILTGMTIHEALRYHNLNARRLILPLTLLTLSGILELCNYQFHVTYVYTSLFQLGILCFLLLMGLSAALYLKDGLDLQQEQRKLEFEKKLISLQIRQQDSRSDFLARHEALLRQQRHDLRHHITAIQALAGPDNRELQTYLQGLLERIPTAQKQYCENQAVNGIIAHYAALCKAQGISLDLQLVVPPCRGGISDSALCILFGNLLENAVEACGRMTEGPRFIRLHSGLQYDLLTITMDNSFSGTFTQEDGRFRSSKREDYGIGLSSVQSVARQSGGDAEFRAEGSVFLSSVYVHL